MEEVLQRKQASALGVYCVLHSLYDLSLVSGLYSVFVKNVGYLIS